MKVLCLRTFMLSNKYFQKKKFFKLSLLKSYSGNSNWLTKAL